MTKMMWAAQLMRPGSPLEVRQVPMPEPGPNEVLVSIEASGICHTDLHICRAADFPAGAPQPLTLGHEGIGRVVKQGPGATTPIGTRVGIPWIHSTCDHCRPCLTGHESFCASQLANGYTVNGTHAEYSVMPERFAVRIPEPIASAAAAPLMCAGVTAFGAVQLAELAPGKRCVVIGCGGLGQYAIQIARLFGASVVAVDMTLSKLERARVLGARETLLANSRAGTLIRAGGGADAIINFAPSPRIWSIATEAANTRATIVSVAMVEEPVPLSLAWLTHNGVRITGASVGTRQQANDLTALAAVHAITIPVETIALADVNRGMDRLARGEVQGRLVIDFGAI